MARGFTWFDGERRIHFGDDVLARAPELLLQGGFDDYSLLNGSPALKIGFVPFDPNQAGRTNTTFQSFSSVPASMAPSFPLQLMDPSSF